MNKRVIGRVDIVDLPGLGLSDVEAKVDTGAYTSAIHCTRVKLLTDGDVPTLSFHISRMRGGKRANRRFLTEEFREKIVRNSFGHTEKRFVIRTRIRVFGKVINASFTLSNRTNMRYPILLGRKLLKNRYVVDVSAVYLSYSQKQANRL
ncbi:MAG: ATP-dependent zinc protease [Ferruginibacter sp.]|nr:ATP-dependent zinc protease [Cytophagales bacterium]